MGKKRTEAYFILLLLTACHTADPPGEDQPASSAATETTADDSGRENKYSQIIVPTPRPDRRPPIMLSPDSTVLLRRDSLDFD